MTVALRQQTQLTESGLLANAASQLVDDTLGRDAGTAMLLALEGLPDKAAAIERPYMLEAEIQLDRALTASHERAVLVGHRHRVTSAAWSPDGAHIVTASYDNTARVWEAVTGKEVARLEAHGGAVYNAAWSPDGARIVTASVDQTAQVWEAGRELSRLEGRLRAAFSPDGSRIVTASTGSSTARVWEAATGKELARLEGHGSSVWSAAWSPDRARIVTTSNDKTARVWEAATGKELARLGHGGLVSSATWSPLPPGADGAVLITTSVDETARLWRVFASTQHLVNSAKDHMRRCLTPAQRKQYFLPEAPPLWCIERRLWPYHTDDWQAWLAARKAGRDVPLPGAS